jgi:hypothetical protein
MEDDKSNPKYGEVTLERIKEVCNEIFNNTEMNRFDNRYKGLKEAER